MLEACVEMRLKPEFTHDGVMVAVYVSIDSVHPFEYLSNHAWEGFWEGDT